MVSSHSADGFSAAGDHPTPGATGHPFGPQGGASHAQGAGIRGGALPGMLVVTLHNRGKAEAKAREKGGKKMAGSDTRGSARGTLALEGAEACSCVLW